MSSLAGERQVLHGHVPAAAKQLTPLRRLEATNRLHLAIVLPLRDQTTLDSLLQELYDPASTNYHRFLAVDDFTRRFGPTANDYQAVETFFHTNGFAVKTKYANRAVLDMGKRCGIWNGRSTSTCKYSATRPRRAIFLRRTRSRRLIWRCRCCTSADSKITPCRARSFIRVRWPGQTRKPCPKAPAPGRRAPMSGRISVRPTRRA